MGGVKNDTRGVHFVIQSGGRLTGLYSRKDLSTSGTYSQFCHVISPRGSNVQDGDRCLSLVSGEEEAVRRIHLEEEQMKEQR